MSHPPSSATLEKIVSLCKRRGFVFQSAEIYGGLNGIYDYGYLGSLIKSNLRTLWLQSLRSSGEHIVTFEGALLGPPAVWKASGHVEGFHDPLVDCLNCKHRYRADDIDLQKACPTCGQKKWSDVRQFNMMFQTELGALAEQAHIAYLRPETAQALFVQFKNIATTTRSKIPFGIAQIGKAFRNEITPKQFLFRMREFEQMEMEWFCKPNNAAEWFDYWCKQRLAFYDVIGIHKERIRLRAHEQHELSHYSRATSDIEYAYPFGWKELEGIANRGNFDLSQHIQHAGKDLSIHDEKTGESYVPHVIESSVGLDRLFLTVMFDAYDEDEIDGEQRVVLHFDPKIAPIKAAFLPLSKKLSEPMEKIYKKIKATGVEVAFDESGSIGKRYRRFDEIGAPVCFTYDFDSETDGMVTARNRDTTKQERIAIDAIDEYLCHLVIEC